MKVATALGTGLLRNARKTERGTGQFLIRLTMSAAPFALLTILMGCSPASQERAKEKVDQARDKTATAAQKLGSEAKAKAKELNSKLAKALDGQHPADGGASGGGTSDGGASMSAGEKLDRAGAVARQKGRQAGAKLDHAGMIAKVKAALAKDAGLSTLSSVSVDVQGAVVTLNGRVSSDDQKRQAQRAVSNIDGVAQVVNNLTVQP